MRGSWCRDTSTWSLTAERRACWVGDHLQGWLRQMPWAPSPLLCSQGDAVPGASAGGAGSRHPRPAFSLPWERQPLARPLWNAGAEAVGGSRRLASCYKKLWRRRPWRLQEGCGFEGAAPRSLGQPPPGSVPRPRLPFLAAGHSTRGRGASQGERMGPQGPGVQAACAPGRCTEAAVP